MSRRALWLLPALCLCLTAAAPAPPPAPHLAPSARVRFILAYPACAVRLAGEGPLPVGLIGMDARQVAGILGDDVVVALSAELLVLERQVPGCPVDHVTLVGRDGMVVVLAGPRGATTGPGQSTGIELRSLPASDVHRIEVGWTLPAGELQATLHQLRAR